MDAMRASPEPSTEPDSRTSSVGRKRVFDASTLPDNNVVSIDDSSEEEQLDNAPKRRRFNDDSSGEKQITSEKGPQVHLDWKVASTAILSSGKPAESASSESDSNSSLELTQRIPSIPQVSWNKGIQGGLRTSFGRGNTGLQNQSLMSSNKALENHELRIRNTKARSMSPDPKMDAERPRTVDQTTQSLPGELSVKDRALHNDKKIAVATASSDGRIYNHLSGSWIIPRLDAPHGMRKPIKSLSFKKDFAPLFFTANSDAIGHMNQSALVGAFCTLLQLDYGDVAPAVLEDVKNRPELRRVGKWLKAAVAQLQSGEGSIRAGAQQAGIDDDAQQEPPSASLKKSKSEKNAERRRRLTEKTATCAAEALMSNDGRTFKTDGMDVVVPRLLDSNEKVIPLNTVNFQKQFCPSFIGLNKETISEMEPSVILLAFDVLLTLDYSDHDIEAAGWTARRPRFQSLVKHAQAAKEEALFLTEISHPGNSPKSTEPTNVFKNNVHIDSSPASTVHSTSDSKGNKERKSPILQNGGIDPSPFIYGLPPSESHKTLQIAVSQSSHLVPGMEKTVVCVDNSQGDSEGYQPAVQQILSTADGGQILSSGDDSSSLSLPFEKQPGNGEPLILNCSDDNTTLVNDLEELEAVSRYYPSTTKQPCVPRCLTCAQTGHKTSQCPRLTCSLCGITGLHFTNACPQSQCCAKCRQAGHSKADCPEKLTAAAEGYICAMCKSTNHVESECHYLWRSFKPIPVNTTFQVQYIPVHCYSCGADGHFGPECGLHHGTIQSGGNTWSKANWEQYVDPKSKLRAPSAGKDYSLPAKKNFTIKGKANDPIVLADSEEDTPFISRKVVRAPRPAQRGSQHIHFGQRSTINDTPKSLPPRPMQGRLPVADGRVDNRDLRNNSFHQSRDDSAHFTRERDFNPLPQYPPYGHSHQPPLPPGPPPGTAYMHHSAYGKQRGDQIPAQNGQKFSEGMGRSGGQSQGRGGASQQSSVKAASRSKRPRGHRSRRGNSSKATR